MSPRFSLQPHFKDQDFWLCFFHQGERVDAFKTPAIQWLTLERIHAGELAKESGRLWATLFDRNSRSYLMSCGNKRRYIDVVFANLAI